MKKVVPFFLLGNFSKSFLLLMIAHNNLFNTKGRLLIDELIDEDSKHPKIDGKGATLPHDHFGCEVWNSSCNWKVLYSFLQFLGLGEIGEFDVTVLEYQEILGLQGSIHYVLFMEIFQAKDSTPKNKPDSLLASLFELIDSFSFGSDEGVDVGSFGPLHEDVVRIFISEGADHLVEER